MRFDYDKCFKALADRLALELISAATLEGRSLRLLAVIDEDIGPRAGSNGQRARHLLGPRPQGRHQQPARAARGSPSTRRHLGYGRRWHRPDKTRAVAGDAARATDSHSVTERRSDLTALPAGDILFVFSFYHSYLRTIRTSELRPGCAHCMGPTLDGPDDPPSQMRARPIARRERDPRRARCISFADSATRDLLPPEVRARSALPIQEQRHPITSGVSESRQRPRPTAKHRIAPRKEESHQ
jgi:hypothetical protein